MVDTSPARRKRSEQPLCRLLNPARNALCGALVWLWWNTIGCDCSNLGHG